MAGASPASDYARLKKEEEPHATRPHLLGAGPLSSKLRWYSPPCRKYSRRELLADRILLFVGAVLSWLAVPLLMYASWSRGDTLAKQAGFAAFGAGLIVMLTASALYHFLCWRWDIEQVLHSLDHIGIGSMIMGSYVPVMQIVAAWVTLTVVLSLGMAGWLIEAYKVFGVRQPLTAKGGLSLLDWLQIARYLAMGWACTVVAGPLWAALPRAALALLLVGGLTYSLGVVAFVQRKMEYHMPVWHLAVLLASGCIYSANLLLVGLPLPE